METRAVVVILAVVQGRRLKGDARSVDVGAVCWLGPIGSMRSPIFFVSLAVRIWEFGCARLWL
jgi:hypothetical protein